MKDRTGKEQDPVDDRRIVELIAARDEAGIAMLREKYGSRLTAIAKNICG